MKGYIDRNQPEDRRRVGNVELSWYDSFHKEGQIESFFNVDLFTHGDSREPEEAGIRRRRPVTGDLVGVPKSRTEPVPDASECPNCVRLTARDALRDKP